MPETETVAEPENPVEAALALGDALRAAADNVEAGPNTDAVKSALRRVSRAIRDLEKVYDTNARLAR